MQTLLAILGDKEDLYEVAFHLSADIAACFYPLQSVSVAKASALLHWKHHVSAFAHVPRPVMKFMYHQFGFKVWHAMLSGGTADINVLRWRPNNIWQKEAWAKIKQQRKAGICREPGNSATAESSEPVECYYVKSHPDWNHAAEILSVKCTRSPKWRWMCRACYQFQKRNGVNVQEREP